MLPRELKPEHFASYPPEARKLIVDYLGTLQRLPLSFVPSLLRELVDFDFRFPAERKAREKELSNLRSLSPSQLQDWFQGFSEIRLSSQLEASDWVRAPSQFVEQLSAHLWTTHQLDAFRRASNDYVERLRSAVPVEPPAISRLGITIIGQGVASYDEPLFRKLRSRGAYFSAVKPEAGLRQLLDAVATRAKDHPVPYGHWYIDGGEEADHSPALTCISYKSLEPARAALLRRMQAELERPGMGPEALRTLLAQLRPADLGIDDDVGNGGVKDEVLLVRFAPRQRQKPMNEMLSAVSPHSEFDFIGSLIDADMGAYYNWLNQQRLPGAEQSSFVVWFEGHSQAVTIGPSTPRGTQSTSPVDLGQLLAWTV
jgi:hypothetical protein